MIHVDGSYLGRSRLKLPGKPNAIPGSHRFVTYACQRDHDKKERSISRGVVLKWRVLSPIPRDLTKLYHYDRVKDGGELIYKQKGYAAYAL